MGNFSKDETYSWETLSLLLGPKQSDSNVVKWDSDMLPFKGNSNDRKRKFHKEIKLKGFILFTSIDFMSQCQHLRGRFVAFYSLVLVADEFAEVVYR